MIDVTKHAITLSAPPDVFGKAGQQPLHGHAFPHGCDRFPPITMRADIVK